MRIEPTAPFKLLLQSAIVYASQIAQMQKEKSMQQAIVTDIHGIVANTMLNPLCIATSMLKVPESWHGLIRD